MSLSIVNPGEFLILAGDVTGFMTAIKYDGNVPKVMSFGVHSDTKSSVVKIFSPDNQTLYTLGSDGNLNLWSML